MDSLKEVIKNHQREENLLATNYEFQARVLEVIKELKIKAHMHPVVFKAFRRDRSRTEAIYHRAKENNNIKNKAGYFVWMVTH